MTSQISHAVILPDQNFQAWLNATMPYMNAFGRVVVIRSPAGNDLNRYRTITAVNAPLMWFSDDPLGHIRRAYPMVVRVDTIAARTPAELSTVLQRRILNNDRYGERDTSPPHIFDRFVLDWPTDARPSRIVRGFISPTGTDPTRHEGIDISLYPGAAVLAGAAGTVNRVVTVNDSLNYGAYVQVTSQVDGKTYVVTYAGLREIAVQVGRPVSTGDHLGKAASETIKVVVQAMSGGLSGYKLPNVTNPLPMIYWQGLRLRPTVDVLRVRSHPGTYGAIIGAVRASDILETQEGHGRTLEKLGVEGQWLRIRRAGAREAYCAAWFLDAFGLDDPVEAYPGIALPGVNIDLDHRVSQPEPTTLRNMGWVRLVYNVSLNPNFPPGDPRRFGNTDLTAAFNRFRPFLERYASNGIRVVLVLNHQTFGEGQNYHWHQMNTSRWREFTGRYVAHVRNIAAQFAGRNLVFAYQIWNEQDTPPEHARAAVPMPATDYAYLLGETIKAIRSVDSHTRIITGGHITGPDPATAYARATLNALPAGLLPDGLALHPYGRGAPGDPLATLGSLAEALQKFSRVLPGRPLWITEWGTPNYRADGGAASVSRYVTGFFNVLRYQFTGQVAAAIWYAWADGMDDAYGLVDEQGRPRQPLFDTYLQGV